jgi:hypothetical protein
MFATNATVETTASAIGRAPSTVWGYLGEFIVQNPAHPLDAWVPPGIFRAVSDAAAEVGTQYQKPIFDKLNGTVAYELIRMSLARLNTPP